MVARGPLQIERAGPGPAGRLTASHGNSPSTPRASQPVAGKHHVGAFWLGGHGTLRRNERSGEGLAVRARRRRRGMAYPPRWGGLAAARDARARLHPAPALDTHVGNPRRLDCPCRSYTVRTRNHGGRTVARHPGANSGDRTRHGVGERAGIDRPTFPAAGNVGRSIPARTPTPWRVRSPELAPGCRATVRPP